MARSLGVGASLASMGENTLSQATQALGSVADQEAQRNIANQQIEQQEKAGRVQLGSTIGGLAGFTAGASMGSVGGPLGALIGGTIGAIAGGIF